MESTHTRRAVIVGRPTFLKDYGISSLVQGAVSLLMRDFTDVTLGSPVFARHVTNNTCGFLGRCFIHRVFFIGRFAFFKSLSCIRLPSLSLPSGCLLGVDMPGVVNACAHFSYVVQGTRLHSKCRMVHWASTNRSCQRYWATSCRKALGTDWNAIHEHASISGLVLWAKNKA